MQLLVHTNVDQRLKNCIQIWIPDVCSDLVVTVNSLVAVRYRDLSIRLARRCGEIFQQAICTYGSIYTKSGAQRSGEMRVRFQNRG